MARRRWGTKRGRETYARALDAGCALLRRNGLQALSLRAMSEATGLSLGAIQFHFGTHDELARAVIRHWANGISRAVDTAAGKARGLHRTWKSAEAWSRLTDQIDVVLEAVPMVPDCPKQQRVRGAVIEHLIRWIEETQRSLRQAQLMHEIKPGVDVRAVALEIHQLLWSRGWTSALCGPESAALAILRSVWHRLSALAIDPTAVLPQETAIAAAPAPKEVDPIEDVRGGQDLPSWKLFLEPSDPLYQAFYRHEIMGDPRTFCSQPEITQDDRDCAEKYQKKIANAR